MHPQSTEMGTKTMSIGIAGVVFLILLTLKLTRLGVVATWSWAAITAPLWLGFVAWILFFWVLTAIAILTKVWRR
jgi:hypothetical protein